VQHNICTDILIIIEHQESRALETAVQYLEIMPSEHWQAGKVFGCQVRQFAPNARRSIFYCETEIVEKGRRIGIALINLIPKTWKAGLFQITAN
jgi:hypothetical protein